MLGLLFPLLCFTLCGLTSTSPTDVPASPCGPSEAQLLSLRPPVPLLKNALLGNMTGNGWSGLRFFIHEGGAFNFSKVVKCYLEALRTDALLTNIDDSVLPNVAEHATDILSLMQLRKHPGRIADPGQADLHIIGSALGASYHAAWALPNFACGGPRQHSYRVEALLQDLRNTAHFKDGRNWLLINTDWQWPAILGKRFTALVRGSMFLATVDRQISAHGRVPPKATIVMPYNAHAHLDMLDDRLMSSLKLPESRKFSFMFHGKLHRLGAGRARYILKNATEGLEAVSVNDASFTEIHQKDLSKVKAFANVTARTAETMLDSAFCLVPVGDTASTRRLFDALAAGCVPIIIHQFTAAAGNLPFPHSIDWAKIAIFAGGLDCWTKNTTEVSEWLRSLWGLRESEGIRQMQVLGREVFQDVLSYRFGDPVSAMLAEIGFARQA